MELLYERRSNVNTGLRLPSSKDEDDGGYKSILSVKCIRGEIKNARYMFHKSSLYVSLRLAHQSFETTAKQTLDMQPAWNESHNFIVRPKDNLNLTVSIIEKNDDGFDREMGSCTVSVERWIANGRFEGPLDLCKKGEKVGQISLQVKLERDELSPKTPRVRPANPPADMNKKPTKEVPVALPLLQALSVDQASVLAGGDSEVMSKVCILLFTLHCSSSHYVYLHLYQEQRAIKVKNRRILYQTPVTPANSSNADNAVELSHMDDHVV